MELKAIASTYAKEAIEYMQQGNVHVGEFGRELIETAIKKSMRTLGEWIEEQHKKCPDPQECNCEGIAHEIEKALDTP